jgi:serine/threonine protein kinase
LLFPDTIPLLPLKDMIEVYDETKDNPYIINIIMCKAETETDADDLLKKGQLKTLKQFFPLFRDCILGITYMHMTSIVHRDIKPGNIMRLYSNKYVLADYGEGENLSYYKAFSPDYCY